MIKRYFNIKIGKLRLCNTIFKVDTIFNNIPYKHLFWVFWLEISREELAHRKVIAKFKLNKASVAIPDDIDTAEKFCAWVKNGGGKDKK